MLLTEWLLVQTLLEYSDDPQLGREYTNLSDTCGLFVGHGSLNTVA